MKNANEVLSPLEKLANVEFMKFVAGKFMFCYVSQKILDYKTTVHIAIRNGDKCVASYAVHRSLWHKDAPRQLFAGISKKGLEATEVVVTTIQGEEIYKAK